MELAIGAFWLAVRDDWSMRMRGRGAIAGSLALLPLTAGGCVGGAERDAPAPNRVAAVREAALKTLRAGPATIRIHVSSATAEYSVRGAMEVATDRFRVRARVTRAPMTHLDPVVDVIGVGGETYEIGRDDLDLAGVGTSCWYDPHQPIGSLGGAASVQEAVALAGVAVRLLRDGVRTTTVVEERADGVTSYRVALEPSKARVAPSAQGGDEVIGVNPRGLARHLAPIRVVVDPEGRIRRLSLELRGFRPPSSGPERVLGRRQERVSVAVSLSDFGRALATPDRGCVAIE